MSISTVYLPIQPTRHVILYSITPNKTKNNFLALHLAYFSNFTEYPKVTFGFCSNQHPNKGSTYTHLFGALSKNSLLYLVPSVKKSAQSTHTIITHAPPPVTYYHVVRRQQARPTPFTLLASLLFCLQR